MIAVATNIPYHQESGLERDACLQAAARGALRSSPYRPLWNLPCKVTEGMVVVSGIVPSFYLKQMAQTLLLALDGIRGVQNLLVVSEHRHFGQQPGIAVDPSSGWFCDSRREENGQCEPMVAVAG